ncbi:MAG: sensor protein CutS [Acidimicrobiales bacterium]|nr:MAG: sensor protein CutS [Acidimicrobiales bacterium]
MTEAAPRLHGWAGSIRFRLTVLYSVLLFGLATVVVGLIYAGVARSLERQNVSRTEEWVAIFEDQQGRVGIATVETEQPDYLLLFERAVNEQALDQLRTYAFGALGLLFVGSLFVGWFVAGLVLRPVRRISDVAKEIEATDLSRRIELDGPEDELKELADTFDGMLGRIDDAFESQREFIHEASHELRNPLAVIRTNIDVALDDPDASAEDLRSVGEVVGRSAERMSTLVDDLLLYARHGTREIRREDVDLVAVVNDLVEEFGAAAEANGLDLTADVPTLELPVRGDGQAIHRAAANLVANAVRLAPAGSTVTVAAADEGRWVTLAVVDEGPGIDPEDQLRVFQRFWRGDKTEARVAGRSGLGLTIVRQIAEAHGGRVELESAVGDGSRFTLRFPRS